MSRLSLSEYLYWEAVLKDEQEVVGVEVVEVCDTCGRLFQGLLGVFGSLRWLL